MNWPIPENSDYKEAKTLPVSTLLRWFLYDVMGEDANDHIELFDLTPVSEEGHQKEMDDSEARVNKVIAISQLSNLYSEINAKYAFETTKEELLKLTGGTETSLDDQADTFLDWYSQLVYNGIMTFMSASVELGLIKILHAHSEIRSTEL